MNMQQLNGIKKLTLAIAIACCAAFTVNNAMEKNPLLPPAGKWNTGVALYSFNKFSFEEAIEKAGSAGAKYVEGFYFHKMGKTFNDQSMSAISLDEVRKVKQIMDAKGISMRSMYVGGAKNISDWQRFFEIGKICGMQFLVCEPAKNEWDLIDSLGGVYGIKIAIHEHAKGKSIYWSPDSVLAAVKGHPNIGACADLGHWVRSGLDPVKCLRTLKGHILGIHVKDVDAAGNPEANDVLVGTGVINYKGVAAELKKQGFSGTAYVECEHDWDNNLADVTKAVSFFDGLK